MLSYEEGVKKGKETIIMAFSNAYVNTHFFLWLGIVWDEFSEIEKKITDE